MKYFNYKAFFVISAVAVLALVWFVGGKSSKAQTVEGSLVEGERFDNINIGKSTSEDVEANYGSEYKLVNHRGYSFEMIYKNLGLSFYYCQNDPNKEIFVVEIEPPARVTTGKGIILGESNFADVLQLYGELGEIRDGTLEYEEDGIYFYDAEETEDEDEQETKAEISSENSGLKVDGTNSEKTDFVIDEEEVSNIARVGTLNYANNLENDRTEEIRTDELEEHRRKIVKRIELIEKGELRQCDDKFPKLLTPEK